MSARYHTCNTVQIVFSDEKWYLAMQCVEKKDFPIQYVTTNIYKTLCQHNILK